MKKKKKQLSRSGECAKNDKRRKNAMEKPNDRSKKMGTQKITQHHVYFILIIILDYGVLQIKLRRLSGFMKLEVMRDAFGDDQMSRVFVLTYFECWLSIKFSRCYN